MNKLYLSAIALLFSASAIAQPCNLQVTANFTGNTCEGSNIQFQATASDPSVSYTWGGPSGYASTLQNPVRNNIYLYDAGNYIVTAIKGSCFAKDTVVVAVKQKPDIFSFSANKPVLCTDEDLVLSAVASGFPTYTYYRPNGSLLSAPLTLSLADSGTYTVITETNGGCRDTATTHIAVKEGITITTLQGPSVLCAGDSLKLSVMASNIATIKYIHPNGGVINLPMTLTTADSGFYKVVVTNSVGCADTGSTHVAVNPAVNTILTIGGRSIVGPFAQLTMFASVAPAGGTPVYQWFRNAVPVPNATTPIFSGIVGVDVFFGDVISVQGAADTICATTLMSAPISIVMDLSVNDIASKDISLYPNPTNGTLSIRNEIPVGKTVNITILDAIGQVMQQMEMSAVPDMQLKLSDKLPSGIYLLQVKNGDAVSNMRFRLDR